MSDIKTFLEESELAGYNKTFPTLSVPTLGGDAEGYLKTLAEAAIEQIKFLNAYSGVPLDVLYENIGQRHKASNLAALSMFRKKSQDAATVSRGLELVDIPDDAVSGTYSNAFLPSKIDPPGKLALSKGLIDLLTALLGTFTGSTALTKALEIVDDWFLSGGVLQQLAVSLCDNIIEGIVTLLVQKILGKQEIVIGDGSAALVPYFQDLVTALTANNYKDEAGALVAALSNDGALVKQILDCCPKEALTKLSNAFYGAEDVNLVKRLADALYVQEERFITPTMSEIVETGLAQRINDIHVALRKDILLVRTGEEPEAGEGEEQQKTAWTQALINALKDWSYQTETLEIGGIRLALRANIIQQA